MIAFATGTACCDRSNGVIMTEKSQGDCGSVD